MFWFAPSSTCLCHLCGKTYDVPSYVLTVSQWEDLHFRTCATKEILKQLEE